MDHVVVNGAAGHLCVVEVQGSWDVRTLKARSLLSCWCHIESKSLGDTCEGSDLWSPALGFCEKTQAEK